MHAAFEILEHTADIGFHAWGAGAGELFEHSAVALMEISCGEIQVEAAREIAVTATGHDYESLLVNWLNEVLFLLDSGRFVAAHFVVDSIQPTHLTARLIGEPRDYARHPWKLIVKAVTYHQIEVTSRNGRWDARVFLDI